LWNYRSYFCGLLEAESGGRGRRIIGPASVACLRLFMYSWILLEITEPSLILLRPKSEIKSECSFEGVLCNLSIRTLKM
jgi:hypothetical protein